MHLKKLTAFTGLGLIVVGLGLIVAQISAPKYFGEMYKDLGGSGWHLHTNVVGFAVLVVCAVLLAIASANSPPHSN